MVSCVNHLLLPKELGHGPGKDHAHLHHLLWHTVTGGEAGRKQYEAFIRETIGVCEDEDVRPTFSCQMPVSGAYH